MSTLFSWSTWTRLFGRKATPVKAIKRPVTRKQQQDFADYGTAFGLEMSLSLRLPLDVLITRKIGAPDNPELAIGALTFLVVLIMAVAWARRWQRTRSPTYDTLPQREQSKEA